jgi:hypothetical protein
MPDIPCQDSSSPRCATPHTTPVRSTKTSTARAAKPKAAIGEHSSCGPTTPPGPRWRPISCGLWFSAIAYVVVNATGRNRLRDTEFADAAVEPPPQAAQARRPRGPQCAPCSFRHRGRPPESGRVPRQSRTTSMLSSILQQCVLIRSLSFKNASNHRLQRVATNLVRHGRVTATTFLAQFDCKKLCRMRHSYFYAARETYTASRCVSPASTALG